MAYKEKCKRCAECCKSIPCGVGLAMLGDSRPCRALEKKKGQYACGMVLHPNKYVDLGKNLRWKNEFLKKLFAHMLGIQMGCCSNPEGELLNEEMRKGFKKLDPNIQLAPVKIEPIKL